MVLDRKTPRRLKLNIYNTVVRQVIMYGSETWALRKREEQQLDRTEMRMLRWMLGIRGVATGGVSIELPEYAIFLKLPEFSFLNFLFIKLPETSFLHSRHLTFWCFSTKKSSAFVKLKERYSRFSIKPK